MKAMLVVACVLVAASAHADDKKQAKQLYEEGLRHYSAGEYPAAIVLWKEAYRLSNKPLLLFNIGQAYRLSGDCKDALEYFDHYSHDETKHKDQDDLDQAIADCKAATASSTPAPEPPPPEHVATPPVAPEPAPPAPTPAPPAPARTPAPVALPLEASIQTPVAPAHPHRYLRDAGLVAGSVGVVAGAAGAYFAQRSAHYSSLLDNYGGPWGPTQLAEQRDGEAASSHAWLFGIGGAALVAAGVTMFVVGQHGGDGGVAIAPTRGGAAVAWGTAF
ncbi:MAG TPA: hypothetical protein VGF94_12015 [Kofleriaceae bacterium]|jgi:tetratricopeptide (TPR) repeat protein